MLHAMLTASYPFPTEDMDMLTVLKVCMYVCMYVCMVADMDMLTVLRVCMYVCMRVCILTI